MATLKQKLALDRILENHGNVSKSMREVGYAPGTAKNPLELTSSQGFRELCEERGLTDNFLLDALVEDIKAKPRNRRPELELGFKVKGRIKEKEGELEVRPTINILIYENHDPSQVRSSDEAISVGSSKEPSEIQVSAYSS